MQKKLPGFVPLNAHRRILLGEMSGLLCRWFYFFAIFVLAIFRRVPLVAVA